MSHNLELLKISELTNIDFIIFGIIILLIITVVFLHTCSIGTKKRFRCSRHSDNLIISINQESDILFNNKIVEKNSVEKELSKYTINTSICIDCNKQTKFDIFITLLKLIQEKNFRYLSIKPRIS